MAGKKVKTDVAVIGAGPAGLAAAIEAASCGARVWVFDENLKPGGQLFKQIHRFFGSREHQAGIRGFQIGQKLLQETKENGVKVFLESVVWGYFPGNELGIADKERLYTIKAKKIIVATGASENPLHFPGWTLPGVMGAGAAQTMMNLHRILPGRKIVMVGGGNVGLIVSYQLLQAGAEILALVEALPHLGGYQVHAAKIRRQGVPILTSHTVVEATGKNSVEKVVIAPLTPDWKPDLSRKQTLPADLVCLAVGLRPEADLLSMANCEFTYLPNLGGFIPLHNENMETTNSDLLVAGDTAGVEEASSAMEEGRLAGICAAMSLGFLKSKEAKERKREIMNRLEALRKGPFGEDRQKAKEKIWKEYEKYEGKVNSR